MRRLVVAGLVTVPLAVGAVAAVLVVNVGRLLVSIERAMGIE